MSGAMSEQRNLHVLIVEDEPGDERLMRLALRQGGFAVDLSTVSDGHEAQRFLRREGERFGHASRPDLILLDLKMPGQNGLEFLAAVKQDERLRAIPVVVITTSTLDADVLAAYQHGAAGYVQKPTDINEFIGAIEKLGQYWFNLVRLPENPE